MKATALLQAIYTMGLVNYPNEARKWVNVMNTLGVVAGRAHSLSVSEVSKLDLMLRQLEQEHLEEIIGPEKQFSFATDLICTLSDSWLLASYEPIRAACEQTRTRKEPYERLDSFHRRLALVRIPIAKAEIKDAQRLKPTLMLYPIGDGDDNSGKLYAHDGSYIVPKGVCAETGATVWYPIDLKTQKTVAICRRDLSDEFLGLFD
ncbi:hypothetical protein LJR098_000428 [Rhizobium sp. LjRoot98]|uniref:hypothetical protein n=1 Tax=unclassified Rhizobium TaxID=2613769 RepID=UPI0007132B22|nr:MULTISPECIES: hypothetical protein [unclassified Rhizobium]KQV37305.1 hypothetical protein ASC96_04350 [Rhizobium sp. Root1204]KQY17316.1 hypothetical protein ASD36_01245 [Rhizobium sp. Root1334]KRC13203.1 hypothetical protein ASE23_01250 [Rhizobium sp. Root73]